MCEASVYILKEGAEELVFDSVELLEEDGDEIRLVDLFGEEKKIKAKIKSFSLVNHRIVLEQ